MAIQKVKDSFIIQTPNTTYVMALRTVDLKGTSEKVTELCSTYWGKKLLHPEEVPCDTYCISGADEYYERELNLREYPSYGAKYYDNECLKVCFADGVRDLRLTYKGYVISEDGNQLTVTLKDIYYPFEADLVYTVYDGLDIIDKHTVLRNLGSAEVTLETFYSAAWTVPYSDKLMLTYMSSAWGAEYAVKKQPLPHAALLLESRAGVSNATAFPYFALDLGNATEHSGEVWFGTLQYSGNWQIKAGRDRNGSPLIVGGISDFNSSVQLAAGHSFTTPVFTGGYVEQGHGGASRQLHDYIRKTSKTLWTNKVMPVIYNAWATFEFHLEEEMLCSQAELCSKLGIEAFLIDDGWFKNRNDDKTGLGDWEVDDTKFPNGLGRVIEKVNALGMIFGIWIEPEMVTEESGLYKKHPEWILHYPTRQPVKKRNQYVLNFGLEEVYQYTISWLDKLLTENNIGYLKLDMNRFLSEVNWNGITKEHDEEAYMKYVSNFYRLCEHIHTHYPGVLFENCSSGGLRADLSMSKWCARINRSDNQDCIDALRMHEGYTKVNLTKAAGGGCHMHHPGTISLTKRGETMKRMAFTGMMGSLSVGYDLRRLTEQEFSDVAGYIKIHKQLRETVQLGDMYRLSSVYDQDAAAVMYQFVSKDQKESVVFVFNNNKNIMGWLPPIKLLGLADDTKYAIQLIGTSERNDISFSAMSGNTLMNVGLCFQDKRMLCDDSVYGCFAIKLSEEK